VKAKKYEIWSEGYRVTGGSSGARLHGTEIATSFKEACVKHMDNDEDRKYFDEDRVIYWGCRLYDNESDARKTFG